MPIVRSGSPPVPDRERVPDLRSRPGEHVQAPTMRRLDGAVSDASVASLGRLRRAEPTLSALSSWRYLDASLLILIVMSITAFNLLWLSLDTHRFYWDYSRHLGDSLVYKDAFTLTHPLRFFDVYVRYP